MNPPSDLSVSTGLSHAAHAPLEPPLFVKQGRQRKRVPSEGAFGSGYIVASGRKGDLQIAHEWVASDSFGWRTEP
jgi:hypothetical protein